MDKDLTNPETLDSCFEKFCLAHSLYKVSKDESLLNQLAISYGFSSWNLLEDAIYEQFRRGAEQYMRDNF